MSLNALDIKKVVDELSVIIKGGKVEKLYQHTKDDLIITIYKNGNTYHLYFNTASGMTRLHLLSDKPKAQPVPSSFVMLMRKYLKNSIIEDICQVNEDRIVKMVFSTRTTQFEIIAQLIDKFANIFFLSSNGKILGFIKVEKGIRKGIDYEYPEKTELKTDDFELSCKQKEEAMYNQIVEDKYKVRTEKKESSNLQQTLTNPIKKQMKKVKRLISNLKGDLKKVGSYEKLIKSGQLLQTHFHKLKKGLSEVEVEDYETNENVKIMLNPKLSPQDNVERYFKKAKKAKSAQSVIPTKIEANKEKYQVLRGILDELSPLKGREEALKRLEGYKQNTPLYYHKYLEKIHNALLNNESSKASRKKKQSEKEPFRYFLSSTGKKIYVARNSRENEELVFRFAKGNDAWFHTQNYPGSHVIVPLNKNEDIDGKTFNEAGQLALHYSKAKDNGSADVYFTKRKYLTKPKNAPTGMVNVSKYRTINVIYNEATLKRVLERKND